MKKYILISKNFLRCKIGKNKTLSSIFFSIKKKNKYLMVNNDTDIIIEGFPRSANTYSVVAFQYAQKKELKIAHHLHIPSQIIKGVELNIPTILLIRNPVDAIASLYIRNSDIPIKVLIECYIDFYYPLLKYKNKIVLAPFDDVIKDFGKIIFKVNKKYKTNFEIYIKNEHSENCIRRIIYYLNEVDIKKVEGLAIPHKEKEKLKEKIYKEIENFPKISLAKEIYDEFRKSTI